MEKLDLAAVPTPIYRLNNLSRELGKNIWIKRDDLTGMEYSGNKVRKLEYLFKDALNNGCDYVLTTGSEQSNHARATAAIAARLGMSCILYLTDLCDDELKGNLFLDYMFGAEVKFFSSREKVGRAMAEDVYDLYEDGKTPYVIPLGGSNAIGARGYIECAKEIKEYEEKNSVKFDLVAHATGSGGTYAGLLLGDNERNIVGYSCSEDSEYFVEAIYNIAKEIQPDVPKDKIKIVDKYAGPSYGIPTLEVIDFIKHVAKTEGIIVDTCYTGKALFGLYSDIEDGKYKDCENILFIHTGGMFGLFAESQAFMF